MSTDMKCAIASRLGTVLVLAGFETWLVTVGWQQVWAQSLVHTDTQEHGDLVLKSHFSS